MPNKQERRVVKAHPEGVGKKMPTNYREARTIPTSILKIIEKLCSENDKGNNKKTNPKRKARNEAKKRKIQKNKRRYLNN